MMIYDAVDEQEPIQQGDIFGDLPRVDISLSQLDVLDENAETQELEARQISWSDFVQTGSKAQSSSMRLILPFRPVDAIVITQSCDAVRAADVSLCEIFPITSVQKGARDWGNTKAWVKNLTKEGTDHIRWFYLPEDDGMGFAERRAVDFRTVIRLSRVDLEGLKLLRRGRLCKVAYEHFREKLGQFFRRYPYNPWYPLNREEFQCYREMNPEAEPEPYAWQG
jgi:hypothetical protein